VPLWIFGRMSYMNHILRPRHSLVAPPVSCNHSSTVGFHTESELSTRVGLNRVATYLPSCLQKTLDQEIWEKISSESPEEFWPWKPPLLGKGVSRRLTSPFPPPCLQSSAGVASAAPSAVPAAAFVSYGDDNCCSVCLAWSPSPPPSPRCRVSRISLAKKDSNLAKKNWIFEKAQSRKYFAHNNKR